MANGRGWRHPEGFRRMAVERFKCCENIEWLAEELGVPRQTLYRWHEESQQAAVGEEQVTEKSRESRPAKRDCRFKAVACGQDRQRIDKPTAVARLILKGAVRARSRKLAAERSPHLSDYHGNILGRVPRLVAADVSVAGVNIPFTRLNHCR